MRSGRPFLCIDRLAAHFDHFRSFLRTRIDKKRPLVHFGLGGKDQGDRLKYMGIASILLIISATASAQPHLSDANTEAVNLVSNYMILERSTQVGDACFRRNYHRIFDEYNLRFNSAINRLHLRFPNSLADVDGIHWICSKKSTVDARKLKKEAESVLVKIEAFAESLE